MSPTGYQAPVVKAGGCGNERQESSGMGKRVAGKWNAPKRALINDEIA